MPVSWEDYLREVMPDVPGCPNQVAENAIRNSAIEFCTESRAWRDSATDLTTSADIADYALTVPANSEVIVVTKMIVGDNDIPMAVIGNDHLNAIKIPTETDEPQVYSSQYPGVVTVYPTPDGVYTIKVDVILKPTKDSTEGPDFLYNDWLEPIAAGAKARLLTMSNRPWANPNAYNLHRGIFVKGYVSARIRDSKANTRVNNRPRNYGFGFYRSNRI